MSYPSYRRPEPGIWLGLSIAATLLCCMPLGVVGIVYAAKGISALGVGDDARAAEYTDKARRWTVLSALAVLVILLVFVCLSAGNSRL